MSFKSLFNSVTNKFDKISSAIPEIAGDIKRNIDTQVNSLAQEGLNQIGLGEVAGFAKKATDGSFFASMHPKDFKSNLPAKPGPIGFTTKAGSLVPGQSQPPWPNELENFASMSTIITLAALSHKEISDPDGTYRKTGLKNIVCQSGGGAGNKKNKTQVEKALGNNVEFFIDNLEIGANMVPSLSYGTNSNVTTLSFEVTEPYSMGLFYQALKIAAVKAGFQDYTTACFVLQIDFKGWTVDGTPADVPYARRLFPIKLTTSEFSVNEGGSLYRVNGIAWNERALMDSVQTLKTDVSIKGRTVREILQTGATSVTSVMNNRLLEMQEKNQVNVADQFVIIFPGDRSSKSSPSATNAGASGATFDPSAQFVTADDGYGDMQDPVTGGAISGEMLEELWQSYGGNDEPVPENFDEYLSTMSGNVRTAGALDFAMKKYAASDFSRNEIGEAKMLDSPFEGGTIPMPDPAYVKGTSVDAYAAQVEQNDENNAQREKDAQQAKTEAYEKKYPIFARANKNMKLDGEIRSYTFNAGTRLQEIIEEVLLTSMYGRELAKQLDDIKDPFGFVKWYRVETSVFTIPTNTEIARTGQVPSVFVYRIVPYYVHHSVFKPPAAASKGVPELKAQAAKEYNYIYTGKNKDILDFEIAYNKSFVYPITADRGSSTAAQATGAAGTQVQNGPDKNYKPNEASSELADGEGAQKTAEATNTNSGNGGGSGYDNTEIGIARMFNDRLLHSMVDMVKIEMTIMGDPFFLSDNGVGNYHGEDTSYINMTKDGTANFQNGELHVNIVFRTPLDLNPEEGTYIFPEDLIVVDTFSGLYRVNLVTHTINENQYTTRLEMTRMAGQTTQSQTKNLGMLIPTDKASEAMNEVAVDYAKKVSDAAIVTGKTENLETYYKEIQGLLGGYQGLEKIVQKQAASLGLPALESFGDIGKSLNLIQSQLGQADLGKIGAEFQKLQGAATSFASNALTQVNLSGSEVLGNIGTTISDNIGGNELLQKAASTVRAELPNAIEAAASANAEALAKLNTTLGPR